jgi:hypothetical protein
MQLTLESFLNEDPALTARTGSPTKATCSFT